LKAPAEGAKWRESISTTKYGWFGGKARYDSTVFANTYGLPRGILTKFRDFSPDRRISGSFDLFTGFGIGNSPSKPLVFGQQKYGEVN